MQPKDKLIVALDGMDLATAKWTIDILAGIVGIVKVGFEFIAKQQAGSIAEHAWEHGIETFWDNKFHDIPSTVNKAVAAVAATWNGIKFINVHCQGAGEMMREAKAALTDWRATTPPLLLGVTVLTSMSEADLKEVGQTLPPRQLVCHLAKLAQDSGMDGVIASPLEIEAIRETCGRNFIIVTPGIRPAGSAANDQQRIATPGGAIKAGADYIVVGRPITQPESGSRTDAAKRIIDEIAAALAA